MPNEVVPFQNLTKDLATVYQIEPAELVSTVKAMCFPGGAASDPQLFVFLTVAKQLELNPFNREIYAFVSSGKLQTIVGLDGWIKLVNRNPDFGGFEFIDHHDKDSKLSAVTCRMWRKNWKHTSEATEYLAECLGTSDSWKKWPHRMLRNKAYIQCARMTFGFAGIVDDDEAQRIEHPEHWPNSLETTATVVAGASVNTPAARLEAGADRTDTGKPADAAPSATVHAGVEQPVGSTPTTSTDSAVRPSPSAENAAAGAEERHSSPSAGAAPSPADLKPAVGPEKSAKVRKKLDDLIAKHVTAARLNLMLGQAGVGRVEDLSDEQVVAMIAKIESRKGK